MSSKRLKWIRLLLFLCTGVGGVKLQWDLGKKSRDWRRQGRKHGRRHGRRSRTWNHNVRQSETNTCIFNSDFHNYQGKNHVVQALRIYSRNVVEKLLISKNMYKLRDLRHSVVRPPFTDSTLTTFRRRPPKSRIHGFSPTTYVKLTDFTLCGNSLLLVLLTRWWCEDDW